MKPSPVLQRPLGQKHLQREPRGNLSAKGPEVPTRWAWVGSRMVRCGVVAGDPHPHSGEGKGNLWSRPCADVPTNADLPQTEDSLETAIVGDSGPARNSCPGHASAFASAFPATLEGLASPASHLPQHLPGAGRPRPTPLPSRPRPRAPGSERRAARLLRPGTRAAPGGPQRRNLGAR